jgi:zinc protease
VPLATVEVDVRNGSMTQTPEYAGLAHMFEHMMFKANTQYPQVDEYAQRIGGLGATYNASTLEEQVYYYATVPSDSLAPAMNVLAAAFLGPLFKEEELAREKQVVIGEFDRQESNPFFSLQREMGKKLWGDQWSRKNLIGERSVILGVTPEKMRTIQREYYVPNNSALIVTGDVQPDKVFALAQQAFGGWQRGPDPFQTDPIPEITPLTESQGVIIEQPVSTVAVLMQWQGPSVVKDPQSTYAADVFSDVMNQDGSGFQRRLVDSGLWHSVLVNYYTLNHTGPITISGETTPDKLRPALAALEAEIAKFDQPGYFSAEELEPVKQQRIVGTALGLERSSGFAHELGFWWCVSNLDYYLGYVDNMARQTPGDLRAYVKKYIVGKPHVSGLLIAPEARQQLGITVDELVRPVKSTS